jgi:hypothetical protein
MSALSHVPALLPRRLLCSSMPQPTSCRVLSTRRRQRRRTAPKRQHAGDRWRSGGSLSGSCASANEPPYGSLPCAGKRTGQMQAPASSAAPAVDNTRQEGPGYTICRMLAAEAAAGRLSEWWIGCRPSGVGARTRLLLATRCAQR